MYDGFRLVFRKVFSVIKIRNKNIKKLKIDVWLNVWKVFLVKNNLLKIRYF